MSLLRDYEIIEKLGQGTFGVVQKAKSRKTGKLVAIKQLINHSAKEGFPITAMREITILKQLNHKNILTISDMIFEEPKVNNQAEIITTRGVFYTVTPYMSSDLVGLLENPKINFELDQIKCIMQQLFTGIQYIHNQNFLHRDIKAANILIDQDGILKIADFGLARVYHGNAPRLGMGPGGGERPYTGLVVTRWYRPPEILLGERKYTTAVDLWGIGCVFAELFTKKPILVGRTDAHQAEIVFELVGSPVTWPEAAKLPNKTEYSSGLTSKRTLESRFKNIMPPDAIKLLDGLLTLDPYKRLNALDALNHEFFKNTPRPLLPDELPKFEESHEIDKERFRRMKDKDQITTESRAPTELKYENHSETRYNAEISSFGGDKEYLTLGKSEYNSQGERSDQKPRSTIPTGPSTGGRNDRFESRTRTTDHYESRTRTDHYESRSRNESNSRNDYRRNQSREDLRDSGNRTRDTLDSYVPKTGVEKIREQGESIKHKYDSYSRDKPVTPGVHSTNGSPARSKLDIPALSVKNGVKSQPDLPSKPMFKDSPSKTSTVKVENDRPRSSVPLPEKPKFSTPPKVSSSSLAIPNKVKSTGPPVVRPKPTVSMTPVVTKKRKVSELKSVPMKGGKKSKSENYSNDSDSCISDVDEDCDFEGENAKIFDKFLGFDELSTLPIYRRVLNEAVKYRKKVASGH
ncbi:CRK1 Serine/threonine-protein kinase BUR1 [Candida maltosa Xu316]